MSAAAKPVLLPKPGDPFSPWMLNPDERHRVVHKWRKKTKVSWSAVTVLLYLFDRTAKNSTCWPRVSVIADDLGLSENQARRILKEIETAGAVRIQHHGRNGNVYVLLWHEAYVQFMLSRQARYISVKPTTIKVGFEAIETNHLDGELSARHPISEKEHLKKTHQSSEAIVLQNRSALIDEGGPQLSPKPPRLRTAAREAEEIKRAQADFSSDEWEMISAKLQDFAVLGKGTSWERPINVTPLLVARILSRGNGSTAEEVAYYLDDRLQRVRKQPSLWPRDEGWFVSVVENEFSKLSNKQEFSPFCTAPVPRTRLVDQADEDSGERLRILGELRMLRIRQ